MLDLKLQDIYDLLNIDQKTSEDISIQKIVIDSREVEDNCLFIPIIGERFDGHDFVDKIAGHNFVTLWQKDHGTPKHKPYIIVDDTKNALWLMAHNYLEKIGAKVIAVTGSNGKTSTKDMIYSLLKDTYKVEKTPGNRNNEIGMPLSILNFDSDVEYVVLEMGMETYGEIDKLCKIAKPDIAMITSIGSAHLENFGALEGIVKAKLEILDNLKKGGLFLYDDTSEELLKALKKRDLKAYKCVGIGKGDAMIKGEIHYLSNGMTFNTNLLDTELFINSVGHFQAHNALFAIYVAKYLKVKDEMIKDALSHVEFTKMRLDIYKLDDMLVFDDTYKSNPESAKAAIETLAKLPGKKHIAVLSDMLDLGENTDQLHYDIGLECNKLNIDALYVIGPLSLNTYEAFKGEKYYFEDKDELIKALEGLLKKDVAVLFKGSRAMKMEEVIKGLKEKANG